MTQRILITNDNGASIGVVVPADNVTAEFCLKDVPVGYKYKIVEPLMYLQTEPSATHGK